MGGCIPSVRRPFLVGSSLRSAEPTERNDWSLDLPPPDAPLDRVTADALARVWLRDALDEHASVAAFARFTMLLLSVGAPPDLIARSQRASLDELRHAQLCFALAQRYSGRALGPSTLAVHDSMPSASLSIAALTAEEGCVGETLGAALAGEQLGRATDPVVRKILREIEADETQHAELAWRYVSWAVAHGGAGVKRAVVEAAERAIEGSLAMEIQSYDGIDLDAWHVHGRLTCTESYAIVERDIREVVRPCLAQVLGGMSARASSATALS